MLDAATLDDTPPARRQEWSGRPPAGTSGKAGRAAARARRSRNLLTGLVSGITGFVIGAVFWHFVGFWSFVSQVVLKGPEEAHARIEPTQLPQQRIKIAGRLKDAVRFRDLGVSASYLQAAVGAGNCAEVRVDRGNGQAAVQACTLNAAQLPNPGAAERTDRLPEATALVRPAPSGWTVQVQAGD